MTEDDKPLTPDQLSRSLKKKIEEHAEVFDLAAPTPVKRRPTKPDLAAPTPVKRRPTKPDLLFQVKITPFANCELCEGDIILAADGTHCKTTHEVSIAIRHSILLNKASIEVSFNQTP